MLPWKDVWHPGHRGSDTPARGGARQSPLRITRSQTHLSGWACRSCVAFIPAQCSWYQLPNPVSIRMDSSDGPVKPMPRPESSAVSTHLPSRARSLELKPWLATVLRPALEAVLLVFEAGLRHKQGHILPQRSGERQAMLYPPLRWVTVAAPAQVTNLTNPGNIFPGS